MNKFSNFKIHRRICSHCLKFFQNFIIFWQYLFCCQDGGDNRLIRNEVNIKDKP